MAPVLLIPGLFQNSKIFDLIPEQGISVARYLETRKNLHVYMLHVRGIEGSCYPGRSNLDDISIDDIPAAINFVYRREGMPVIAIGHSQGGMTLQAALSGLDRCDNRMNCFSPSVAVGRQRSVLAMGTIAANARLSGVSNNIELISWIDLLIPNFAPGLDRITAESTLHHIPGQEESSLWESVYYKPNTTPASRLAFFKRTLNASTTGILNQFGRAVRGTGLASRGGEKYHKALKNLSIPAAEVVFEYDAFANPEKTERDNFNRYGSEHKAFFQVRGQGHLDFSMNAALHNDLSPFVDWLINSAQWRR